MWQQILPGFRIKIFMTILTGVIYPLAITGICQVLFPHQANGSLIVSRWKGGGLGADRPELQQARSTSSRGPRRRATMATMPRLPAAPIYGPTNQKLVDRVKASMAKFRKENPDFQGPIPADLVTASASGLDPHISPDSAEAQVARVAKARGLSPEQVSRMVGQFTENPDLGVLGEPRVNVLKLNLALDGAGAPAK